jgi:23S rRNA (cytosine1962-C5)-methyltransferase
VPAAGPLVIVNRRGADRLQGGHPWIYRSDVVQSDAAPGDVVRLETERRRPLGWALWSSTSQIALRAIGAEAVVDDRVWLAARLASARAYRESLKLDATAWRLVHGEADGLPALVVDRYGDYLVVQTLCQGMDRRLALIVELLAEMMQPRGILARNDPKVRRLEGLDEQVAVLHGEVPDRVDVRLGAVRFSVDLQHGQKTGMFLDQRENYETAARYARGRALDAFTYQGGFAMAMAPHASEVIALDASAAAVEHTRAHAKANGFAHVDAREGNVFDELREFEVSGARFDTIVLDPPAFAKNKASVPKAVAGYKEINLRAMRLLAPGGHLITCSCSYNVDEALFLDIVHAAAVDARSTMALVEKRMQSRDHPVLLGVPETYYLKCLVLRKMS